MAGLYIHIPFCVRKCLYCDFVSYPKPEAATSLVPYLCKEMELRSSAGSLRQPVDTIFIGGGTPSLLDAADMGKLLDATHMYNIKNGAEITVECNPGTLTRDKARGYVSLGVNRLSIGLQSADDGILRGIGRIHTYADFVNSFSLADEAGFTNINIDVMHGLPGQTVRSYLDTLKKLCALPGVKHISSYRLILEENTPLATLISAGKISLPTEDETADMDDAGIDFLNENGFIRYEISNFAREGYSCKHNINYWKNGSYIGIGPAAHGSLLIGGSVVRYENTPDIGAYCRALDENRLPEKTRATVSRNEEMFETIMLALRMTEGVSLSRFYERFGRRLTEVYAQSVRTAVSNGYAELNEDTFRLTPKGMDMQNLVLLPFMDELPF